MKTLGIDPGTSNFACVSLRGIKVCAAYMVDLTVTDLKEPGAARKQLAKFAQVMWPAMDAHDHVACERYMNRGVRSATGELVNIMLGALLVKKDMLLLPAVTWKNAANRVFSVKQAYKAFDCPPHLLDALLIAAYQQDKKYSDLTYRRLTIWMTKIAKLNPELCRNIKKKPDQLKALKASFVR